MSRFQFFVPSPRAGEGWGEGAATALVPTWNCYGAYPSP